MRFVVPISLRIPPLFSTISEIRNDPPISTICPLEQITSDSRAKALIVNSIAAALLFTINELSEPQIDAKCSSICDCLSPRLL